MTRAMRTLARSLALAVVAIATLVLGIGVNLASFEIVNAMLLEPLPLPPWTGPALGRKKRVIRGSPRTIVRT